MKISLSWLENYVSLGAFKKNIPFLSEKLTLRGIEVSSIEHIQASSSGVVVGQILKIEKHPHADRLSVCEVTDGKTKYQIVCGAHNIQEKNKVPFAKLGAILSGNFEIKKAKLRGIESSGMLCSQKELGLPGDSEGIFILPDETQVGIPFENALQCEDTILTCEVTPNRGDCLSHLGMAREIVAFSKKKVIVPKIKIPVLPKTIKTVTSIRIQHEKCLRYAGVVLEDVRVKPSPLWLQSRLRSVGLKPINNIVDVTNFVLMELGQPLHAFDFDKLSGQKIIVRKPKKGEKIKTLDGVLRDLEAEDIVIADSEKAVAIGGVMGGFESQVTPSTQRILIESACFDPVSIRKTSKRLKLQSESSYRFEREIDSEGVVPALHRAAALMCDLSGAKACKGFIDIYPVKRKIRKIKLIKENVDLLLGESFSSQSIEEHLSALGFKLKKNKNQSFDVEVPSYRNDIYCEADLIEEVLRCIGFDKIPSAFLPSPEKINDAHYHVFKLKKFLAAKGFFEVMNFSFISPKLLEECNVEGETRALLNPISEEFSDLRPVLFPSLIKTLLYNYNRNIKTMRLFEIRKTFHFKKGEKLPIEEPHFSLLVSGEEKVVTPWKEFKTKYDFFDLKGVLEGIFENSPHLPKIEWEFSKKPFLHPGKQAILLFEGEEIGFIGEVHPHILEKKGIEQAVIIAEVKCKPILSYKEHKQPDFHISKYPPVFRDISFVVSKEITHEKVIECITNVNNNYFQNCELFDVYHDEKHLGQGKKSLAYRLYYQSLEHTLTYEEVEKAHNEILKALTEKLFASIRV
ncbi:MAG: phenylalanine--tRNA ligase subunit beta [Deltaproteobacteria bacterium]|nr:phenylalanine--tRNA ligase subunit beta [Deltaproteobacteria bacterium]